MASPAESQSLPSPPALTQVLGRVSILFPFQGTQSRPLGTSSPSRLLRSHFGSFHSHCSNNPDLICWEPAPTSFDTSLGSVSSISLSQPCHLSQKTPCWKNPKSKLDLLSWQSCGMGNPISILGRTRSGFHSPDLDLSLGIPRVELSFSFSQKFTRFHQDSFGFLELCAHPSPGIISGIPHSHGPRVPAPNPCAAIPSQSTPALSCPKKVGKHHHQHLPLGNVRI